MYTCAQRRTKCPVKITVYGHPWETGLLGILDKIDLLVYNYSREGEMMMKTRKDDKDETKR